MDADLHREIVLEIERNKGAISAHERVCEERYGTINSSISAIHSDISEIKESLKTAVQRGSTAAWGANWRAWAVAGFIFVTLLGAFGWTVGQLYALEPARIKAAAAHK